MHRLIGGTRPRVIVVDPISNLISVGTSIEVKAMLARLIDFMKVKQMTALFTSLTVDDGHPEGTDIGISSFMDTWLVLRNIELNGERNRLLNVLKSRGMPHSNQTREFVLTNRGLKLVDAVRDARGRVLVGSRRTSHDSRATSGSGRVPTAGGRVEAGGAKRRARSATRKRGSKRR
jgi:circadian clock protein KaiC